jgi:limonene-1,2-epoxide hydrolase
MQVIQKFTSFYRNLDRDSLDDLQEIYTQDVVFIDPVTRHQGLFELNEYFSALMENTQHCTFDIQLTTTSAEFVFVTWSMTFQNTKLKAGKMITVDGVSELKIEGDKIRYQRDYYDLGVMVYENIPLLGTMIRAIKRRLAN